MHDKRVAESSRQLIDIVAKYSHPNYDDPDRSHDVGTNQYFKPFFSLSVSDTHICSFLQAFNSFALSFFYNSLGL